MIELGKTILSDDIKDAHFVCDLNKCKGACCVEGDLGAPLTKEELPVLESIYESVEPYLSAEGKAAIKEQGLYVLDDEDDFSTPTVGGRECVYVVKGEKGILKCGIEMAWKDGKTGDFKKPISCHLYPIRIQSYDEFDALNYDQWEICDPACHLGSQLKVPLYKFLSEALIRKYGDAWYKSLCSIIEDDTIPSQELITKPGKPGSESQS